MNMLKTYGWNWEKNDIVSIGEKSKLKAITCYTKYLPAGEERILSFMDVFLDDRWAQGDIRCPENLFSGIGNRNIYLKHKQGYEFLLRIAECYPVKAVGTSTGLYSDELAEDTWEAFQEDCYITGKFQQKLLETEWFNPVIEALLLRARELGKWEAGTEWLEKMIGHSEEYYNIDDNIQPILFYKSESIAFNLLNIFVEQLASSLTSYKQRVEIFDVQKEGKAALKQFIGRRFKAIIAIQSPFFDIKVETEDGTAYLHDMITGPKYNMILDHPLGYISCVESSPKDYHFLIHDRNYIAFADRYYKKVGKNYHFSPGGILPERMYTGKKEYSVSFIGTYYNYRERLDVIKKYSFRRRIMAARYIYMMRQNPNITAESAFQKVLDYYQLQMGEADFLQLFYEFRQVYYCVVTYYREIIIKMLLDGGVQVDVFGDKWKTAPFAGHKNLICHPNISVPESLAVMQKSKITLNIMSWHKDGFTERIANALLCQSVLLSDKSTYLMETFVNGEELVLFDLAKLEELPGLVSNLLEDDGMLEHIAEAGYKKAVREHLWKFKGKELLAIVEENVHRN